MAKVKLLGKTHEINELTRISDLIEDPDKKYIVATVNHRLRELSYKFLYDADIEMVELDNIEAISVYHSSLRYLIAMAFHNLYPDYKIKFKYSLSRTIFCYITNKEDADIPAILK